MKKIALLEGIHSSVLGFGCAPILGSVGAKESLRAISCALEYGVNHNLEIFRNTYHYR